MSWGVREDDGLFAPDGGPAPNPLLKEGGMSQGCCVLWTMPPALS